MSNKQTLLVTLVGALAMTACAGSDATGQWQSVSDSQNKEVITLSLEQDGDEVKGSGQSSLDGEVTALTVSGHALDDGISVELITGGLAIATYRGAVGDDQIKGTFRSGSVENFGLVFRRQ